MAPLEGDLMGRPAVFLAGSLAVVLLAGTGLKSQTGEVSFRCHSGEGQNPVLTVEERNHR